MADKYHLDTQEKIETIIYNPGLQDSGDLETATRTITATAEATGTENADYNKSLTLAGPGVSWFLLKRVAERLDVTIDSMTAGTLYCRVYADSQVAANRLFDLSWAAAGAKVSSTEQTSGTIFNLLTDGQVHTFYFFFWVNTGNAVLSLVRLRELFGSNNSSTYMASAVIDHTGLVTISSRSIRAGTASATASIHEGEYTGDVRIIPSIGSASTNYGDYVLYGTALAIANKLTFAFKSGAADELSGLDWVRVTRRSGQ